MDVIHFGDGKRVPHRKSVQLTAEEVACYFHLPLDEAARAIGVSPSILKRTCRKLGIKRWPFRKIKSLQKRGKQLKAEEQVTLARLLGGLGGRAAPVPDGLEALRATISTPGEHSFNDTGGSQSEYSEMGESIGSSAHSVVLRRKSSAWSSRKGSDALRREDVKSEGGFLDSHFQDRRALKSRYEEDVDVFQAQVAAGYIGARMPMAGVGKDQHMQGRRRRRRREDGVGDEDGDDEEEGEDGDDDDDEDDDDVDDEDGGAGVGMDSSLQEKFGGGQQDRGLHGGEYHGVDMMGLMSGAAPYIPDPSSYMMAMQDGDTMRAMHEMGMGASMEHGDQAMMMMRSRGCGGGGGGGGGGEYSSGDDTMQMIHMMSMMPGEEMSMGSGPSQEQHQSDQKISLSLGALLMSGKNVHEEILVTDSRALVLWWSPGFSEISKNLVAGESFLLRIGNDEQKEVLMDFVSDHPMEMFGARVEQYREIDLSVTDGIQMHSHSTRIMRWGREMFVWFIVNPKTVSDEASSSRDG
eukprot:TRINITY_DN2730_c0_g2_i1.p1 TRINITY_DN2730_c0_g2~~TRINITY_DN2730_c0_g2_i1.p1  ORF type:complete len:522 (+),score=181.27 TRINITY_DN2730_c0_g2_i1:67-1632(+)